MGYNIEFVFSDYGRFIKDKNRQNDFVLRCQEKDGQKSSIIFEEKGLWNSFKRWFFSYFIPNRYKEYDFEKIITVFNKATTFTAKGRGAISFKTFEGCEKLQKFLKAKEKKFYNENNESEVRIHIDIEKVKLIFTNSLVSERDKVKIRIKEAHNKLYKSLAASEKLFIQDKGLVSLTQKDKQDFNNLYKAVKKNNLWASWSDELKVQFLLRTTDTLDDNEIAFLQNQIERKLTKEEIENKSLEERAGLLTVEKIESVLTERMLVTIPNPSLATSSATTAESSPVSIVETAEVVPEKFCLVSNVNTSNLCYVHSSLTALKNHGGFSRFLRQHRPTIAPTKDRFIAAACLLRVHGDLALRKPLKQFLELVVRNCASNSKKISSQELSTYKSSMQQHSTENSDAFDERARMFIETGGIGAQIHRLEELILKNEDKIVRDWFLYRLNQIFDAYNNTNEFGALDASFGDSLRHEAFLAGFEEGILTHEKEQMDASTFFSALMDFIGYVPFKMDKVIEGSHYADVAVDYNPLLRAENRLQQATTQSEVEVAQGEVQSAQALITSTLERMSTDTTLQCPNSAPPSMIPIQLGRYVTEISRQEPLQVRSVVSKKKGFSLLQLIKNRKQVALKKKNLQPVSQTRKIKRPINIPDVLNFHNQNAQEFTYYLRSFTVHEGNSTKSGHYYTYTRNLDDGKWYRFDDFRDPRVCAVDWRDIEMQAKTEAYMLYYEYIPPPPMPES